MKADLLVASTWSADCSLPSVILRCSTKSYLFNAAEGFQRICTSRKIKLGKIQDAFFTRSTWDGTGGLPGLLLTIADLKNENKTDSMFKVHGAPNLSSFLAATRHFIFRQKFQASVNVVERSSRVLEDDHVVIEAVALGKSAANSEIVAAAQGVVKSLFGTANTNVKPAKVRLAPANTDPLVLSYIVRGHDFPGKFDPKAAIALGVKPGRDFAKLVNGETVTVWSNGAEHTVRSSDVIGPNRLGFMVGVVDIPTADYIFDAKQISNTFNDHESESKVVIVLLGRGVASNKDFHSWRSKFDTTTKIIVFDQDSAEDVIHHDGWAVCQRNLGLISKNNFPPLQLRSRRACPPSLPDTVINPASLDIQQLLPQMQWQPAAQEAAADLDPEFLRLVEEAKAATSQLSPIIPDGDLQVTTLGTGSAVPAKYRTGKLGLFVPSNL